MSDLPEPIREQLDEYMIIGQQIRVWRYLDHQGPHMETVISADCPCIARTYLPAMSKSSLATTSKHYQTLCQKHAYSVFLLNLDMIYEYMNLRFAGAISGVDLATWIEAVKK